MSDQDEQIVEQAVHKTYIEDPKYRNVTLCKRKSMLLRKTIELSNMCRQDIFMCIFDKEKQKILEFRTSDCFDAQMVQDLLRQETKCQFQYELFTNTTGHLQSAPGKQDSIIDDLAEQDDQTKKVSLTSIKNDFKEVSPSTIKDVLLGVK